MKNVILVFSMMIVANFLNAATPSSSSTTKTMTTTTKTTSMNGQNYDAQFLDRMIKHHQEGIAMAKMAQQKSQTQEIKDMTQKMINDQQKELTQMQQWRNDLYANVPKAREMGPAMDMSELQSSRGKVFDDRFLAKMSEHHEMGMKMFEEARVKASNQNIRNFANEGARHQSMEIQRMEEMKTDM